MYRYIQPLFLLLMLSVATQAHACGMGEMTDAGYENASVAHAYQHWKQGAKSPIPFVFVDVRTKQEFDAGHVPGALHIPVSEIASRMHEIPKNKRVYVYCEAGVRAAKASAILAKAGFGVENLPESMRGWRKAGYPIEK